MIRNVIFDLGGVLITWRPQEIIDAFFSEPEVRAQMRDDVFRHADWVEMDRGTLDELAVAQRSASRVGREPAEMTALLEFVKSSLLPIAETVELLGSLRARGLKLYALSNISEPMFRHIEARYDFFRLFHGIVISGAIRLVKPEPAIYEHLRDRFALDFAESVFIDDLPQNVEAARGLGLAAIRFESPAQCVRELEALL